MKIAVMHRVKLLQISIWLMIMLWIKGSASAYSFEDEFFASEPEVTEIVDTTRGIKYKGLVGEIRHSDYDGQRVKRQAKTKKTFYNGTAYVFLNIPYAQKLTPETVFELPKKLTDNSSMIARNVDETNFRRFGNYCPQVPNDERQLAYRNFCYSQMNIDCLNLNVFSPDLNEKPDNLFGKYPVYVLLHGGKFTHGSACDFGRQGLIHNFVNNKIVVVTLNYRLGLYGFHKKNADDISSNRGLYDQKLALEWVRDNIHAFYGDPTQVTLGGFDSGACSAAMLTMVSHYDSSFELFNNVILHAGTADVCRKGGVFDQDVKITASLEELKNDVTLHNKLTAQYELGMQYQVPDGIYETPVQMMEKALSRRRLNVLMGINRHEFIAFERASDKFDYYKANESQMIDFFAKHVPVANYSLNSPEAKAQMTEGLKDAFGHYKTVNGSLDGMRMMMDYVFVHGIIRFGNNLTMLRNYVYIYLFDIIPRPELFVGQESELKKINNVSVPHGTDVRYAYLAPQYWQQLRNNSNKALVDRQKKIGMDFSNEVLISFIKDGNPGNGLVYDNKMGLEAANFLLINETAGAYNSFTRNMSSLFSQKTYDLWERFTAFRESGISPKLSTTLPPLSKETQSSDISPKLSTTLPPLSKETQSSDKVTSTSTFSDITPTAHEQ